MKTFLTQTGHGHTVVQVIYTVKDGFVDTVQVYKSNVNITDVLSEQQIMEIESEADFRNIGEQK